MEDKAILEQVVGLCLSSHAARSPEEKRSMAPVDSGTLERVSLGARERKPLKTALEEDNRVRVST